MPFVRIILEENYTSETKDTISTGIHQALVQEFNIPIDDYFHVIEECKSENIKYPKNYLGINHAEPVIYIQIIAGKGRTKEQKQKLYANITMNITKSTDISKNNIIITLLENNGLEDWSFGNGEIQKPAHLLALAK